MHLAEINIGRTLYPLDDRRMADFMDNLDRVNAVAERSEGFVWRLRDDSGNATGISGFDDPDVIVNLSVWQDASALENFVWKTVHRQFYERRQEWFSLMTSRHFVMWHVEDGHMPTLGEARARLDHFNLHGNSDHAFDWSHLPGVKLWQQARCG